MATGDSKVIMLSHLKTFLAQLKGIFVAKQTGYGLSKNDYTDADKTKLDNLKIYDFDTKPTANSTNLVNSGSLKTTLDSYETTADAAKTYLSKTDAASTYATKTDISGSYLSKTDASSTYQTKVITKTVTLKAASWISGKYSINDTDIKATSAVIFDASVGTTSTNYTALQKAKIACSSQTDGTIVLQAFGTVPTSDVIVSLMIL